MGHEHRWALLLNTLLAETHIWEGNDTHKFQIKVEKEVPDPQKNVLKDDMPYLCI